MSARRAIARTMWRRRPDHSADVPPVFWGRIGEYEAVTRRGILLMLAPEPAHPSQRVTNRA
jgi:hypothetical protein